MQKVILSIAVVLFVIAALFLIGELWSTYRDVSVNRQVIHALNNAADADRKRAVITKAKIKEFSTNPKAAERLLRERYDMIRKDQYIIHDKNH